jgi:Uma2 family endonuclease
MATMSAGYPRRYRITADEYFRMVEAGALRPDARVELIEGEIIDMPPIGSRHAAVIERLDDLLVPRLAGRAMVRVQHSIVLNEHSMPQPDVAVVAPRDDYYEHAHPRARDVLLIIEVSDSTLSFDRDVKAALYARNEIPEFWVVDLAGSVVTRRHSPRAGAYTESVVVGPRDSLAIDAFPDVRIDLSVIFPS